VSPLAVAQAIDGDTAMTNSIWKRYGYGWVTLGYYQYDDANEGLRWVSRPIYPVEAVRAALRQESAQDEGAA
jgi:hypothetical protein